MEKHIIPPMTVRGKGWRANSQETDSGTEHAGIALPLPDRVDNYTSEHKVLLFSACLEKPLFVKGGGVGNTETEPKS